MCAEQDYERIVNKIMRSDRLIAVFLMNGQFFTAPSDGKMAGVYLKDGAYILVGTYNHGLVESVLLQDIELAEDLDKEMSNPVSRLVRVINSPQSLGAQYA